MSKIIRYAKLFSGWDRLIGACERNIDLLPGVESLLQDLISLSDQAKQLKLEQEDLEGHRKGKTQTLLQTVKDGLDMARNVRNFIKVRLGPRSERLTQFGIAPLRTRSRKANTAPPPKPAPETAAPEEGTGSSPPAEGKAPPATTDANRQ